MAGYVVTDSVYRVKTRLQVQSSRKPSDLEPQSTQADHYNSTMDAINKIVADEGVTGLYSGMNGALLGVASTNFAYFYWYSVVRTLYESSLLIPRAPSTAVELSLGAVAGAVAQVFTIPVSVITTRQQTQIKGERKGFFDTGKEVIESEDGITGLWRGLKASLVLVINPAITYGAYQRLKDLIFPNKINLRPWEAFREKCKDLFHLLRSNLMVVLGAMSKTLATIVTQPLIVAKVGLQSRPPPDRKGKPFKSFIEVMQHIVNHEGPMALFKGIGPQILKGLFVQGILMMIKERMELLFVALFAYVRHIRDAKVKQAVAAMKSGAATASDQISEKAQSMKLKETAEAMTSRASTAAELVSERAKNLVPIKPV